LGEIKGPQILAAGEGELKWSRGDDDMI